MPIWTAGGAMPPHSTPCCEMEIRRELATGSVHSLDLQATKLGLPRFISSATVKAGER